MIESQISAWGNSLGLRIPAVLAKELGLEKGSRVRTEIKHGKLVVYPAAGSNMEKFRSAAREFDLKAALGKITPENMPDDEWLNDAPVGREIW